MPEWFSCTTMKGTMLPCEHSANKANTRRGVHSDAYKTVAAASNARWRRGSREPAANSDAASASNSHGPSNAVQDRRPDPPHQAGKGGEGRPCDEAASFPSG